MKRKTFNVDILQKYLIYSSLERTETLIKYLFLGFIVLTGGIFSTAEAVNWIVPGAAPTGFPNIQAALDSWAVIDSDTITVIGNPANPIVYSGPGFYDVDFNGKDVTVQAGDAAGNLVPRSVIIDCNNQGRAFIFQSGETLLARLQGFIIRNGYAEDPSWPREPNENPSGYGGAIYIKESTPIIIDCEIYDCTADAGGGAIFCDENGDARITACDIGINTESYNFAGWGFYQYIDINDVNDVNALDINDLHSFGGGIYCWKSSPWIINCNIQYNEVASSGGGVACVNSNALIRDCTILENDAWVNDDRIDQHGGGIYIKDCKGRGPRIERGTIIWNTARWSGGGIAIIDSNSLIDNCEIYDNHCWARAGGIYSEGNPHDDPNVDPNKSNCIIKTCNIVRNLGYRSGGVSSSYGSVADIENCTIAYNAAAWNYLPGGLECYYGAAILLNSIIHNNYGVQVSEVGSAALKVCGDEEHPYPVGDLNRDCHVDFRDFATMARHWLECTAPECD